MTGRYRLSLGLVLFLAVLLSSTATADVKVRGYYRKDGTYVRPHYRSNPDGNFWNNWSTVGNVNPYTGKPGTKRRPPKGYGGADGVASEGSPLAADDSSPEEREARPRFAAARAGGAGDPIAEHDILVAPKLADEPRIPDAKDVAAPLRKTRLRSARDCELTVSEIALLDDYERRLLLANKRRAYRQECRDAARERAKGIADSPVIAKLGHGLEPDRTSEAYGTFDPDDMDEDEQRFHAMSRRRTRAIDLREATWSRIADRPGPTDEQVASARLSLAEQLYRRGMVSESKKWLVKVVDEHPKTDSALRAKVALDRIAQPAGSLAMMAP